MLQKEHFFLEDFGGKGKKFFYLQICKCKEKRYSKLKRGWIKGLGPKDRDIYDVILPRSAVGMETIAWLHQICTVLPRL